MTRHYPPKARKPRISAPCVAKFCSMKITQEVRDFAAKQNQGADSFLAATADDDGHAVRPEPAEGQTEALSKEEAEQGMEKMSALYKEKGEKLYLPEDGE